MTSEAFVRTFTTLCCGGYVALVYRSGGWPYLLAMVAIMAAAAVVLTWAFS